MTILPLKDSIQCRKDLNVVYSNLGLNSFKAIFDNTYLVQNYNQRNICLYVYVCVFSVEKIVYLIFVYFVLLLQKSLALGFFELWQQILKQIEVKRNKIESMRCGRFMFCIFIIHRKYAEYDNTFNTEDLKLMFCFLREKIKRLFSIFYINIFL